jgi:hypothetical protein
MRNREFLNRGRISNDEVIRQSYFNSVNPGKVANLSELFTDAGLHCWEDLRTFTSVGDKVRRVTKSVYRYDFKEGWSFCQLNSVECKPPKLKVVLENVEASGLDNWELQKEEFNRLFRRV